MSAQSKGESYATNHLEKLGIGKMKPTNKILHLADQSSRHPYSILERVLVKVEKFVLLIDFIVLDIDDEGIIPIILVRPFWHKKAL